MAFAVLLKSVFAIFKAKTSKIVVRNNSECQNCLDSLGHGMCGDHLVNNPFCSILVVGSKNVSGTYIVVHVRKPAHKWT